MKKRNNLFSKTANFVITLIMVIGQLGFATVFSQTAYAAETGGKEIPITFSNEQILHNGAVVAPDVAYTSNSAIFDLSYDWSIKNDGGIKQGDYFLLTDIPSVFKAVGPLGLTVNVMDANTGDQIATGKYEGTAPMKFVFSKDMDEQEITGNIKMEMQITYDGEHTASFTFNNHNYTITDGSDQGTTPTTTEKEGDSNYRAISKGGRYDYDPNTKILTYSWSLYLNHYQVPAGDYTIEDSSSNVLSLDSTGVAIRKETLVFRVNDAGVATSIAGSKNIKPAPGVMQPVEDLGNGKFKLHLTIPENNQDDFEISYKTSISVDDPNFAKLLVAGSDGSLKVSETNQATLIDSSGNEVSKDSASFSFTAGGEGIGDYATTGQAKIIKTDADDSSILLAGAKFDLKDASGQTVQTVTTDDKGVATVDKLQPGTYQFVEVAAPAGYKLNTTPASVTVEAGKSASATVTDEAQGGSVILTKKDADSQTILPGAVFELQDKDGNAVKSALTTDAKGQITVDDLKAGDYQFVETKAPTGYKLDDTPVAFTIEKGQTTAKEVSAVNELIPGSVVLTKQDADSKAVLPGAVFELQDKAGNPLQSALKTDAAGKISVDDLKPGDYQFVETQAPDGYELDKTPVTFTIEKGQTTAKTVTATNELTTGGVILTKTDATDGTVLAGAVFQLQKKDGTSVQSALTTDENGKISVDGLKPGDYQFVETKAPAGYDLDKTPVTFTIDKGQKSAKTVSAKNKLTPGSVILTKKDADSAATLSGAIFELDTKGGTVVNAQLTTDANGKISVDGLAPGDYQFVEKTAPTGYDLDKTPVTFTIDKGQKTAKAVTATDKLTPGSVILTKKDADTAEVLPGAVFELQDEDGTTLQPALTTDESGKISVDDLKPGDYQFVEKTAPAGYDLDKTPITFTIDKGQTTAKEVTATDEQTPGSVILTKKDADTAEALSGAVFELQDKDGNTLQAALKTDANGKVSIDDLKPGNYQFIETQAPTGYELSKTPVNFTIEKGETTAKEVTATNELTPGGVVLTKTDSADGTVLPGAVFQLQKQDGTVVQSALTTDENGKISVDGLKPGNYQFVETKAPAGYDLDKTPVTFTIDKGQKTAKTVSATNKLTPGSVILTKKDADTAEVLPGAVFELQDKDGTTLQPALTTDESGKISVDDLEPGNYQFVEKTAPTGYDLDKTPITFTIDKGQTTAKVVTATDEQTPGSVILTKKDADTAEVLPGAVFELQDKDGNTLQAALKTDANGKISVDDLKPGNYQFIETQAPTGYELSKTPVNFTIEKGQKTAKEVTATNELTPGGVVLTKTDSGDGTVLPGAVFQLQKQDGTPVQSALTTDENGKISVDGLKPGNYQFVETKAPAGYDLDKTPVTFTIDKGQTTAKTVSATNKLTPGSVILTKKDTDSAATLQGAIFELDTKDGKVVKAQLTTDENGKISVDGLQPGNYKFVEKTAPTGYDLDKTPVTFTIDKGQTTAKTVTATNKLTPGSVTLTKEDADTAEVLPGAVFELQQADGTAVKSDLTTDDTGKISVDGLQPGSYQFVETQAPTGYELDQTPVTFTIDKGQKTAKQVTKTDKIIKGSVILDKLDNKTGAKLAGAVFKLVDAKGETVLEQMTTDENGRLAVENLRPGSYELVEIKAPKGYELDAAPVKVTVKKGQTKAAYLTKTNEQKLGSVRLEKRDSQSKKLLAGAVFDLTDAKGTVIKSDLTTDKNGVVEVSDLPEGSYQFIETKAPEGYDLDKTAVDFVLDDNHLNATVTKFDQQTPVKPKTPRTPNVPETPVTPEPHTPTATTPPAKGKSPHTYQAYPKTGEVAQQGLIYLGAILLAAVGAYLGFTRKKQN